LTPSICCRTRNRHIKEVGPEVCNPFAVFNDNAKEQIGNATADVRYEVCSAPSGRNGAQHLDTHFGISQSHCKIGATSCCRAASGGRDHHHPTRDSNVSPSPGINQCAKPRCKILREGAVADVRFVAEAAVVRVHTLTRVGLAGHSTRAVASAVVHGIRRLPIASVGGDDDLKIAVERGGA
jgi:hypothetical protein